jgi:hypothetical protein
VQPRLLVVSVLGVGLLCGAAASPAAAQVAPRTTIAGGYTYVREQGPGGLGVANYPIGWVVTGSQRLGSGRFSGVGEFGISSRDNFFDEQQRLLGLLGGARFGLLGSPRMTLYAQALIGLERFSEPGLTESGLAIQPGAGLDWTIWSQVFIRVQGDYRMALQDGGTFTELRALVGAGVRIGR